MSGPSAAVPIPGRVLRIPRLNISLRFYTRSLVVCVVLAVVAGGFGVLALATGDFPISVAQALRALVGNGPADEDFIVNTLRLPRVLTAILVGASLAVAGALFQSLSRNPLGSPDIIGFESGAATGALLQITVFHVSGIQIGAGAVVGGLVTALVVYLLAARNGVQGYRLILVGIGIGGLLTAVNGYLLTRARLTDAAEASRWLTGSLNGRSWEQVQLLSVAVLVLLPLAIALGRSLRILELGDDAAYAVGLPIERTRLAVLPVGVGLAAIATAVSGPVVFVALAAPQLARRLTQATGPNVIPAAFMGATLLVASDFAAQRVFAPRSLPVGVMTGSLGGLYLIWLLAREWKVQRG